MLQELRREAAEGELVVKLGVAAGELCARTITITITITAVTITIDITNKINITINSNYD